MRTIETNTVYSVFQLGLNYNDVRQIKKAVVVATTAFFI